MTKRLRIGRLTLTLIRFNFGPGRYFSSLAPEYMPHMDQRASGDMFPTGGGAYYGTAAFGRWELLYAWEGGAS